MQGPAHARAVPPATFMRAAAAEAVLSGSHADTARALASALSGKGLGGFANRTMGRFSGRSFPHRLHDDHRDGAQWHGATIDCM